jgi:hypothetical protein
MTNIKGWVWVTAYHKFSSSMYMCFYNTLTICSRWNVSEVLINKWYNVTMAL